MSNEESGFPPFATRYSLLATRYSLFATTHHFDPSRLGRAHHRVEYRHAMQHVVERYRMRLVLAHRAGEFAELGMQHVEGRVLDDLVRRRRHRPGRRLVRSRHEAEALQVR